MYLISMGGQTPHMQSVAVYEFFLKLVLDNVYGFILRCSLAG